MIPVLSLAVAPDRPASIPDLFRSDVVRRIIENPPVSRHNGFNILTYERATIVDGERYVIGAWRKRLELHKDGTFIALATFSDLLGWPREGAEFAENPKINSLALVEFTFDWVKTYNALLDHLDPLPIPLRWEIGIRGAHTLSHPLWIAPYALGTHGYEMPTARAEAPADSVSRIIETMAAAEEPHINAGAISLALIELIYNWFRLTTDVIPYTSADRTEIDPQSFSAQ